MIRKTLSRTVFIFKDFTCPYYVTNLKKKLQYTCINRDQVAAAAMSNTLKTAKTIKPLSTCCSSKITLPGAEHYNTINCTQVHIN